MIRARGAAALLLLLLFPELLSASEDALQPQGEPRPVQQPRDDEFGVATRHLGLERRVEMYQWRGGERGYERVWSAHPIRAGEAGSGHHNPGQLPLPTRNWRPAILLDGHPVDKEVVERLGRWRRMRPSFTALPVSLAATFQPEGDGLGSATNPLAPEIGDLRITWHELVLPDLAGSVELRDRTWRLASGAAPGGATLPDDSGAASEDVPGSPARDPQHALWFAVGALGVLVLILLVVARRRPR